MAVAETGSVRSAAQRLVVTESAVSAAVAALTRDVGLPLLERQGRGLRLTASGRTYAGYARAILVCRRRRSRRPAAMLIPSTAGCGSRP